jgi:hypothetical protein
LLKGTRLEETLFGGVGDNGGGGVDSYVGNRNDLLESNNINIDFDRDDITIECDGIAAVTFRRDAN